MTEEMLQALVEDKASAMAKMCLAFAATVRDRARYKSYFPMIAEGPAEMILRFRKEIDDLIGLTDYVAEFGIPPTNEEIDSRTDAELAARNRMPTESIASPTAKTETVA